MTEKQLLGKEIYQVLEKSASRNAYANRSAKGWLDELYHLFDDMIQVLTDHGIVEKSA